MAAETPWDFSEPPEPGSTTARPNLPCAAGRELGAHLARLVAPALEAVREQFPTAPKPCVECAFVAGTAPNGTAETLMDAIKCVVECVPFYCHKGVSAEGEPSMLCRGWVAALQPEQRAKIAAAIHAAKQVRS